MSELQFWTACVNQDDIEFARYVAFWGDQKGALAALREELSTEFMDIEVEEAMETASSWINTTVDEGFLEKFRPDEPGVEERRDVLRRAGWSTLNDNTECFRCGLYSFQVVDHCWDCGDCSDCVGPLCGECERCRECGCECEEDDFYFGESGEDQ